jgi:hypothetical protein
MHVQELAEDIDFRDFPMLCTVARTFEVEASASLRDILARAQLHRVAQLQDACIVIDENELKARSKGTESTKHEKKGRHAVGGGKEDDDRLPHLLQICAALCRK